MKGRERELESERVMRAAEIMRESEREGARGRVMLRETNRKSEKEMEG